MAIPDTVKLAGLKHKEVLVDLSDPRRDPVNDQRKEVTDGSGNLWSSELAFPFKGMHAPILDLDFECELVESSTEGHYHLYLGQQMTWQKYEELLVALMNAGILQRGYVELSLARKASFLRKRGVAKAPGEFDS